MGLIHISRLTDHSVSHASEVVSPGDEVTVRVGGLTPAASALPSVCGTFPRVKPLRDVVVDWVVGDDQNEESVDQDNEASNDEITSERGEDQTLEVIETL